MRIAIAGAAGFVGTSLVPALLSEGHRVVALGRTRSTLPVMDGVEPVSVDIGDAPALGAALDGVEVAYYLVHSMAGTADFAERDRALARTFATVARDRGVKRIVYVGALGTGELSEHLTSRQEVGDALRSTGLDVVELRAAVVLGAGSISFEMLRYLVERLPVMVCPRWLRTRMQPIAKADLLRYLIGALDVPPDTYEVGGEPTTYLDMIREYARIRGLAPRRILQVPLLTLRLSAYWVDFVTPVDRRVSHSLIGSLASEVLVGDAERTRAAFGITPMGLVQALEGALDEQSSTVAQSLLLRATGLRDGVYTVRARTRLPAGAAAQAREDLRGIGGDLGWYGVATWWRVRLVLGRLMGERGSLSTPTAIAPGAAVDWWTVADVGHDSIVLRATRWAPGEAWLGYEVAEDEVRLTAAFRPKGVPGLAYWKLLAPVHRAAFLAMARTRARRAA